ncbi:type II toxin-antitoxin system prevent-host-death family antitoxin [bacterium]|nr:type II toxin-antitoxin system prevent-host-death family antitoxin [bacterium]
METIAVSDLRARLMKVLKEIESGSAIDITSRGKVVARLVPPEFGRVEAKAKLRSIGKTAVLHDIVSPVGDPWESER